MGNSNRRPSFFGQTKIWPRPSNTSTNPNDQENSFIPSEHTATGSTYDYRLPSLDDGSLESDDRLVVMDITGSRPLFDRMNESSSSISYSSRFPILDILNNEKLLNTFRIDPLPFKSTQENIFVDMCVSVYDIGDASIIRLILSFVDPLKATDKNCAFYRKTRRNVSLKHVPSTDRICVGGIKQTSSPRNSISSTNTIHAGSTTPGGPNGDTTGDRIRIVVVGESCVGKTKLVKKFHASTVFEKGSQVPERFQLGPSSTGGSIDLTNEEREASSSLTSGGGTIEDSYDIRCKIKNFRNETCRFDVTVLDTGGMNDFKSLRNYWLSEAHVAIFVYDISQFDSFFLLNEWYANTLVMACNDNRISVDKYPLVLVANKCDLYQSEQTETFVTHMDGLSLSEQWNVPFFEVSAEDDVNVEHVFHAAILEYWIKLNLKR